MTTGPSGPGQEQCAQGFQVIQRSGEPTKDSQRGVTAGIAPAGRRASFSEQKSPKDSRRWGTRQCWEPQRGRVGLAWGWVPPERAHCESSPVPGPPKPRLLLSQQPPHLRIPSSNSCQWQLGGFHGPESASLGARRTWSRRGEVLETVAAPTGPATPGFLFLEPCALSHWPQTGLGARPHCRHCPTPFIPWVWALWVLPERVVAPSPPQPSALALSPQESRNPSRPGSGPRARLVASPPVTPGGQLRVWPHQLPPSGHGWGLWEQPVPPACVPSPFRGPKTGGSPVPAPHPRTGQLCNRTCFDSLRSSLPRGPSARSEKASQASRGHRGGFGGSSCPAAWLQFLGMREAQSRMPRPPMGRTLGWAGLQVARGWGHE